MPGTPSPTSVSTRLQRVAGLARRSPSTVLTTLAHHIDVEFLREAYRRTRKDGAPGVDRQTAEEYARRKVTVEPVFGQIKQPRGIRQFLLRGIEKVRAEWSLICLTHNLLKLHRAAGTA